jgi:acyl-CoA thioester hydrolase
MARIKLLMPEKLIASFTIPVRITDINYGNHVGNDSLVGIVHESRVQWLAENGYTELNIEGVGLIMADLAVQYQQESFYGDVLQVDLAAAEITRISFELYYSIRTNRNGQVINIAVAKTGMVCYDYTLSKVVQIPDALILLLNQGT